MTYETATLPCGLRIICAQNQSHVASCGIAVDAGTRDEFPQESGIAHFTEHLSFKGTQRRKAWHIIHYMECVGGDLNAYTGKEETVYYCTFLSKHYARAIDLLFDIVFHSTYPQAEMNKEVEVVIDEIESYNDSPSELIYDDFEDILFNGHSLGRNILGEATRLRELRSQDILDFTHRLYRPDRMVLFFYGNISLRQIVREAEKQAAKYPMDAPSLLTVPRLAPPSFNYPQEARFIKKDTHQAHVMIGTRGYGAADKRQLCLFLLSNILGGPGMSSRLNLSLREKNGLVYSVESALTTYTDTGVWGIYFGCDDHDVQRCLKLTYKELARLMDKPLSEAQLRAAKRQIQGQIGISWDNNENVAIGMGKRYLHYGTTKTCQQLCNEIDALTPTQLWDVANDIFRPEKLITLIYQ